MFIGLYWERYGWIAPEMEVSGLEDEYLLATEKPRLIYVKRPAPNRDERLTTLLGRIRDEGDVSYRGFATADEVEQLVRDDLALLLGEAFQSGASTTAQDEQPRGHRIPTPPTPLVGRAAGIGRTPRPCSAGASRDPRRTGGHR